MMAHTAIHRVYRCFFNFSRKTTTSFNSPCQHRRLFRFFARRFNTLASVDTSVDHDDTIDVHFDGFKTLTNVPLIWLRDCCQCPLCMHNSTHQRSQSSDAIKSLPVIRSASSHQHLFNIVWEDGHHSTYDKYFVKQQFTQAFRRASQYPLPELWTAKSQLDPKSYTFPASALDSTEGKRAILKHFLIYGFALINGVEPSEADTFRAVSAIAKPFDSIYGLMWTFTSNEARSDTAYTTLPIAPHTDTTYYQTPLRLMALHCIERNAHTVGGESIFVDGFEIARQLQQKHAELYKSLFEIPQEFCYVERSEKKHYTLSSTSTVLRSRRGPTALCEPHELLRVRFNMYDRGFSYLGSSANELATFHTALSEFQRLTLQKENQWRIILQPGTLALYDNWRVLHARTAFEGRRVLTGCYVEEEEFSSALTKYGVINGNLG